MHEVLSPLSSVPYTQSSHLQHTDAVELERAVPRGIEAESSYERYLFKPQAEHTSPRHNE